MTASAETPCACISLYTSIAASGSKSVCIEHSRWVYIKVLGATPALHRSFQSQFYLSYNTATAASGPDK